MKSAMIRFAIAFCMVLGFSGMALAGGAEGGAGDCDCIVGNEVAQTGPYLKGEFTVAPSHDQCSLDYQNCPHLDAHLFLRWGNRSHIYAISTPTGDPLCGISEVSIKNLYKILPCKLEVEGDFGLVGTPVIKELIITDRSGCGTSDPDDDAIRGEIIIGVVPTLSSP
jgi:hypothetical protein